MSRVLVFALQGERFALPAELIAEVAFHVDVRPLPGLPEHLAGLIRHRGSWLPALSLARALGLPSGAPPETALIARRGRIRYALLVDGVEGVRQSASQGGHQLGGTDVVMDDDGVVTLMAPETLFKHVLPPGWEEEMARTRTVELAEPLVVFRVGESEFGVEVGQVLEVLPYEIPRKVPGAPDFLDGIIELRGAVVPVVDLRRRFELDHAVDDLETRTLVVSLDDQRIGLMVDRVSEVLRLPTSAITDAPSYFRGLAAEYLGGIARAGDRLIMVLRIDRLLSSQERIQLREAGLEESEAGAG